MANTSDGDAALRLLEPHWNYQLITASIAVSLLGAFTSTQMMCQARTSREISGVLVWTILGSLTFGFCSIWSLHFIAMLACELDVRIGLDVPLTLLSAVLAVSFTFAALASDLLRHRYLRILKKRKLSLRRERRMESAQRLALANNDRYGSTDALLGPSNSDDRGDYTPQAVDDSQLPASGDPRLLRNDSDPGAALDPIEEAFAEGDDSMLRVYPDAHVALEPPQTLGGGELFPDESSGGTESLPRSSGEENPSGWSSGTFTSESSSGLSGFLSLRIPKMSPSYGFLGIVHLLYHGATLANFGKGFVWSLAITSMHYVGIIALKIPDGHFTLQPFLVLLSAVISWLVCTIGYVLIPQIEVNLAQQLFFSVIVAAGVAAMHFTGMWATTFWSRASPSEDRGYPPDLAVAVTSIGIVTCMFANGLLAHAATVARNKLAEIVQTRRRLWAAIAQKENAEAAALARSEFIASASHEIRTPLHQLQGYSDLLSRTPLSDESRLLLLAMQEATRSLSLITANVLDWSRLEKGEAQCRPVALDLRKACESIINILPNKDAEAGMELLIVVAPDVPKTVFLDETYLQRILMNLLTNALKFTQLGYVILLLAVRDQNLVVTVQDSGLGIPDSFLPHLFEPFKQAQTRGAERGTGLGLAIIRQLLDKIDGTIAVESRHHQVDGVGSEKCGSNFTCTIPIPPYASMSQTLNPLGDNRRVAVFQNDNERLFEGLQAAWQAFGFEVILAGLNSEISDSWRFIWTDLEFLRAHPELRHRLLRAHDQLVLLPYDSQWLLDKVIGPDPSAHLIPIKRPFLWHRMIGTMMSVIQSGKSSVDRSVRFAPVVDVLEDGTEEQIRENKASSGSTILLVEDNKINQRLGVKMLKTLGYNVITADDGQDAIDKVVEHDADIDLILMDQSMPRKDGVTAVKEIREMENSGMLSRKRPIAMCTAVVGPDAKSISMSAGADDFLPKPLALSKLEQTLKKFLG